jgi:hypothetical protein
MLYEYMEEPNTNPNSVRLLKSGVVAHSFTDEERSRGGQAKTQVKQFNAVINGLMARQDLTTTQRLHLALLRSGQYLEIFQSHFAYDLLYAEDLESASERAEAFKVRQIIAQKILKMCELFSLQMKDEKEFEILSEMVKCLKEN